MLLLSQGADVQRREFIMLLGGAAVAWPIAARAQQPERVRRIGIIVATTADDAEFQAWVGAFLQALALLGWAIGRNMRIDTRWASANPNEIRRNATELAALAPDVILAHGASTVKEVLQATRTVPVVFPVVSDPVGAGYVESMARPGGNATGFTSFDWGRLCEMAGTAQANCTERNARCGPSGHTSLGAQPVCCYPGRSAVT
jgi:putative ABC transport system substrate-binding protein